MDRLATIISWQWRNSWRRVMNGRLNAGNQALILILVVVASVRYLTALSSAATALSRGQAQAFELLLSVVFLVWMFPLLNSGRSTAAIPELRQLPLTIRELFAIRIFLLLLPPYAWFVLAGSFALCWPVTHAPNPLSGIVATVLFILFSAGSGLTIAELLRRRFWRRALFGVLLAGGLTVYLGSWPGNLFSKGFAGPVSLVSNAATGVKAWLAVGELGGLAVITMLTALWSFKRGLQAPPPVRPRKILSLSALRLPGPLGGLIAKDLRYFRGLLDPYLGVAFSLLGCVYLLRSAEVSRGVFQLWLLSVIVPSSALAFNLFGLDTRSGLERLRLFPVTAKTILFGKDAALLIFVGLQITPMVLLGAWRLGPTMAAIATFEAFSTTVMFLAWGNWTSVNHPFKMNFFEFSNASGLVLEALAGLTLGGLPSAVAIYFVHLNGLGAAWKVALIALVSVIIFVVSSHYAGERLTKRQDHILSALA